MALIALRPRSFPFELAHHRDPAIDWAKTAVKMGLIDEPFDREALEEKLKSANSAEAKEAVKAQMAELLFAVTKAQRRYNDELDVADLAVKDGEELSMFRVSCVDDEAYADEYDRRLSLASQRGEQDERAVERHMKRWLYQHYVEPPKGVAVSRGARLDMGYFANVLAITSVSKEPEDDVKK